MPGAALHIPCFGQLYPDLHVRGGAVTCQIRTCHMRRGRTSHSRTSALDARLACVATSSFPRNVALVFEQPE
jgi:hypothetical protein